MSDPEAVKAIEAELARDRSRFSEIEKLEARLLHNIPHDDFRAATERLKLRSEKEMLDERMCKNRRRLVDAKQ